MTRAACPGLDKALQRDVALPSKPFGGGGI